MSILYHVDSAGNVTSVLQAPKGDPGPKGASGDNGKSAYELWLDAGNTGTLTDFFRDIAPETTPSRRALATTGTALVVPTGYALVSLTVTTQVELSFADFVSSVFGTNPEGYSFTLHLIGSASTVTFAPGVGVHGSIGAATDVWCTVIREGGAWQVLIGVAT